MTAMDRPEMRRLVGASPVGRLGTIAADGRPHLVPIVFALDDERIVCAVDGKPKRGTDLARLTNIRRDPRVTVLVDRYDEDWSRLWWVRIDGTARVVRGEVAGGVLTQLRAKYQQYEDTALTDVAIVIDAERWTGWRWGN